jgi:hypothetical protein
MSQLSSESEDYKGALVISGKSAKLAGSLFVLLRMNLFVLIPLYRYSRSVGFWRSLRALGNFSVEFKFAVGKNMRLR